MAASPITNTSNDNFATGQATPGTSAALIAAARTSRGAITIVNGGTTDVYIGGPSVTTSTGALLAGTKGASLTLALGAAVYGVVASGTQLVSYVETF